MRGAGYRHETGAPRRGGRSRARALAARRTRRHALALTALALSLALTTAAHAQLGDPGEDVLDTDYTPVAKPSEKWEWWAGARYRGTPDPSDVPEGSATPFELDFFDVAFHDRQNGLAGGAICAEPVPERSSPDEARAHTDTCPRVPALYRYSVDSEGNESWSPLDLGESAERRGYIGAIAWLDSDTALAVGGDGCYPRREEPCPDGEAAAGADPIAGKGRAWLYENGSASELEVPGTMRGLTAATAQGGGAFAGALRQIWRYENGSFVNGWSSDGSAPIQLGDAQRGELFQFRVRDMEDVQEVWDPPGTIPAQKTANDIKWPIAVTAGCCGSDPAQAGPRILVFAAGTWWVRQREGDPSGVADVFGAESQRNLLADPLTSALGQAQGNVDSTWSSIEDGTWDTYRGRLEDGEWRQPNPFEHRCTYKEEDEDRSESLRGLLPSSLTGPTAACIWHDGFYDNAGLNAQVLPGGVDEPVGEIANNGDPQPWPVPAPPKNLLEDENNPDDPDDSDDDPVVPLGRPELPGPPQQIETVDGTYQEAQRGVEHQARPYGASTQVPDSYYSVFGNLIVASPGGPAPSDSAASEPASHVFSFTVKKEPPAEEFAFRSVVDVENTGVQAPYQPSVSLSIAQNGQRILTTARLTSGELRPDDEYGLEAVGALRSSSQGVVFGPRERDPHRVNDSLQSNGATGIAPGDNKQGILEDQEAHGCDAKQADPTKEGFALPECTDTNAQLFLDQQRSLHLFKLDSYALNAIEIVEGAGWAVGDHGAIHSRQPPPPPPEAREPPARAGAKIESESIASDAFEEHRAEVTDEPGTVPPLTPGVEPAEPGFYEGQTLGAGVPDKIVMSRDGSEGWAFESDGGRNYVYRYDGTRWTCDMKGISGLLPPDPSCSALAGAGPVQTVARVPLERDSDPTNDEEFEVVALTGSNGKNFYRYRNRRWAPAGELEQGLTELDLRSLIEIAFTSPDDAWGVKAGEVTTEVVHFDGVRWVECRVSPTACGDPAGRLSFPIPCGNNPHLAMAGERIYLYGTRELGPRPSCVNKFKDVAAASSEPYPLIIYRDPDGVWRGGDDPDLSDGYNPTDGGWDPGRYFSAGKENRVPVPELPVIGKVNDTAAENAAAQANAAVSGEEDKTPYQGGVSSLAIAQDAYGSYQGWATGTFGGLDPETADAVMMRLDDEGEGCSPENSCWRPWLAPDAASDYFRLPGSHLFGRFGDQQLTLPSEAGRQNAFLFPAIPVTAGTREGSRSPALAFDQERDRWGAIPTPWSTTLTEAFGYAGGEVKAIAPDGRGGFWASVEGGVEGSMHHYTDRDPREVLTETTNPARDASITTMAAARNGTLWLGDSEGFVHRYDRLSGWGRPIRIPGWDPKRATSSTAVNAVAVGPDGEGVAVGDGGRIANIGPEVGLDPAATVGCDPESPVPPCGTGKDLDVAAVAPDGAAIVAGEGRTLLWRPADGGFRPIALPPIPASASIAEVQMPRPGRAYLLTRGVNLLAVGELFRGELSSGEWSWERELTGVGDFAVDASGHGYASAGGAIHERGGDGAEPWEPIASGGGAVAIPAGGGEGAIFGSGGQIQTLIDGRLYVVRHEDPYDPVTASCCGNSAKLVDLALVPGYRAGDIEAWAVIEAQRAGYPQSLLHYSSNPGDPRLDPNRNVAALPDALAPVPGEISFATFGKQDCFGARGTGSESSFFQAFSVKDTCQAPDGSNMTHGLINRRIREELAERAQAEAQPRFALFTGDAVDTPGGPRTASWQTGNPAIDGAGGSGATGTAADRNFKHRRWVEIVAEPLEERGLPILGALGRQDLARNAESCHGNITDIFFDGCVAVGQAGVEQLSAQAGLNLPWRSAMALTPAPWEREQDGEGLRFEPLHAGILSQDAPDEDTPRHSASASKLPASFVTDIAVAARADSYPLGSGDTHYATDVINEETGEKVARIVVVDTSLRSLAASDPVGHPIEAGGQIRWLDEMTCFEGSPEDLDSDVRDCTREPDQRAIVVSNAPTYSYGPISPDELHQGDAAVFESILIKNQVDVVVSGGVGWNGRYWALAPGLHAPCPGQAYRADSDAPSATSPEICGQGGGSADPGEQVSDGEEQVTGELGGSDTPASDAAGQIVGEAEKAAGLATRGAIPFVVSSTAGGNFNLKAERGGFASAENGFWRGYSLIRLHPSGDPRMTIVEQRPILDWVGIEVEEQELEARAKLDAVGYAREAFGNDRPARYYDIPDNEGITHRYHLLLAHPDEPWRACEANDSACVSLQAKLAAPPRSFDSAAASGTGSAQDDSCNPYLCLPERVGTIDSTTGEVKAGNGKYPDTFALAMLSVGDHVAAQPLVFKRSPSFVVNPVRVAPGAPLQSASAAANPSVPNPPQVPQPNIPQSSAPEPPAIPGTPPLAAATPPELQPPAPPSPPPPSQQPSPLDLTVSPQAIAIATPTAVIQPPTPPVNPAPPGGARREARQRQAAAQKSGADSDRESTDHNVDTAQGTSNPTGAAYTRHNHAFTALQRTSDGSLGPALLYGGSITLLALAAALGWTYGRPTPRHRPPEVPAPAYARARWRRR